MLSVIRELISTTSMNIIVQDMQNQTDTIKDRYSLYICLENDADFSGSLSSEEERIFYDK